MLEVPRIWAMAALWAVASTSFAAGQATGEAQNGISANSVAPAVVQAVEDEIYDWGAERRYFEIDNQGAGDKRPARISIYISKDISPDGHGVALYKLMPYGEVYRYFLVRPDGLAVLSDDSRNGFRPIGGSMLTIYMSAEDVADFVMHQSIKASFVVDPEVSKQRLHQAIQRQLERTGFSYRQYAQTRRKRKTSVPKNRVERPISISLCPFRSTCSAERNRLVSRCQSA